LKPHVNFGAFDQAYGTNSRLSKPLDTYT